MPLQSKEVLTPQLIHDCDVNLIGDKGSSKKCGTDQPVNPFLSLPVELRLQIFRHLLRLNSNRKSRTRSPSPKDIDQLIRLDARRILEAPQFRHKGKQEINGVLPLAHTCEVDSRILSVCKQLYFEARDILYVENKFVAVQCGISGFASRFGNYGVPMFGPLPGFRFVGQSGNPSKENNTPLTTFDPVFLLKGQSSKSTTPVYICSYQDVANLLHGVWIMVKSPFARGMRFSVHVISNPNFGLINACDGFFNIALLPWMHNYLTTITSTDEGSDRLLALNNALTIHKIASQARPNVYTYNTICAYLERLLRNAEKALEFELYLDAEALYERICYESCSIIRTRTSKLVDVSKKTKEGINRICKLVSISAFRLCEMRSGALTLAKARSTLPIARYQADLGTQTNTDTSILDAVACCKPESVLTTDCDQQTHPVLPSGNISPPMPQPMKLLPPKKTTRLEEHVAQNLAIVSGILALRLPCATPLHEWNIRLNIMLFRLFVQQGNQRQAYHCLEHIIKNFHAYELEGEAKGQNSDRWVKIKALVEFLRAKADVFKKTRELDVAVVDRCEDVVKVFWGERMVPKKGYIGLVWTFRWA